MTLARAAAELGWPDERWIMDPPGAGPAVNAVLAQKKVGQPIRNLEGARDAKVGVLSADPRANETQAPLALVCTFPHPVPGSTLAEVHRLAWNFSRTPLLLTVDAERLRAFSCCETPITKQITHKFPFELTDVSYRFVDRDGDASTLVAQASHALHWLELVSGRLLRQHEGRFTSKTRADVLLLSNLWFVRYALRNEGLEYDVIHDLLARVIFVQFLFDRRDSEGHTALNANYLTRLHRTGVLSQPYQSFAEILSNYKDCYSLFWYLDDRFNGDLFPGRGVSFKERHAARDAEMAKVDPPHLNILSHFVSGMLELESGQYSLWPNYSFDVIPLEFISSIYEAFVRKKTGTVYTPAHLVDFVLDGVLPWEGEDWDLKILDPSCGSGIFLVKAFQRLIHRWKSAHPEEKIGSASLRSLLERNLFGVDNDSHAVRTASFSLYLAMCDEIDPRHYWTQVRFPSLRGRSLLSQDFFDETSNGVRTVEDAGQYDVVVGNAPWGKNSVTPLSKDWAKEHDWPVSNGDIGPLFLAKSTSLSKPTGRISLIQPGSTLLFNHSSPARHTRERIFREFTVTEIVNFSALRFGLFRKSVGPAVLVTLRPIGNAEEPLQYISPKPVRFSGSDDYRIAIDPYDVHELFPDEVVNAPMVWSALIWGGRRDVRLLERLSTQATLAKYALSGTVTTRRGIIRGRKQIEQREILGKHILESKDFPEDVFLELSPLELAVNENPYTHERDSTNFEAFKPMQLIVKMAWTKEEERFKAAVVAPSTHGVLCTRPYVSVHAAQEYREILDAACLSYNSAVAVYFLLLSSGRFANYRPEPHVWELLNLPIPKGPCPPLSEIGSRSELDIIVQDLFELKPAERVLIEDMLDYTLPDFKGDGSSPGRAPTKRGQTSDETSMLRTYCEWFLRVLKAGFGDKRTVCATIYVEDAGECLPVRLVAFHFELKREHDVIEEPIGRGSLAERLRNIYRKLAIDEEHGISYRRIARVFDLWTMDGKEVPTVLLVKPDESRYWTRSMAMRDADEVSQEILQRTGNN